MQVKCLAQRHNAKTTEDKTHTQDLSILSRRPQSLHHDALHVYGVYILDVGTLEGGHCQGSCHP